MLKDFFLQISNSTNTSTISSSIDVVQILILVATFGAVGVTVWGVITSNQKTQDSNNLLRKDIDSRVRPWFIISDIVPVGVSMKDGSYVKWEKYNLSKSSGVHIGIENTVDFGYTISNIGLISAKMKRVQFFQKDVITRDILNVNGKPDSYQITLVPQEILKSQVVLSYAKFELLKTGTSFHCGVSVDYSWDSDMTTSTGKIWKLEPGRSKIIDSW